MDAKKKEKKSLLTSTIQALSTGVDRAQNVDALKNITGAVH